MVETFGQDKRGIEFNGEILPNTSSFFVNIKDFDSELIMRDNFPKK